MEVYIYSAALYCGPCGAAIRATLDESRPYVARDGGVPVCVVPDNPADESSYDSGDYPKGPILSEFNESDSPDHCDACNTFLENPLTGDGVEYVRATIAEHDARGNKHAGVVETWRDFYADQIEESE